MGGVVLLVGHRGSGKTFLMNHLPDSHRCDGVVTGTIYRVPEENNILLSTDTSKIDGIISVTSLMVGKGKHVYIHCIPSEAEKLMVVFKDPEDD